MKKILFSILFFIWLIIPATALLARTPQEVQQQMRQATEDLRKQIADHEKQIAEARKNKEDAETIKGKENGIGEDRMETDGKGETEPIDKNDNPAGKANNRRGAFIKI